MKRMFKTIALAAAVTLALTGCYKHDPVNRNDGKEPSDGRTEEKIALTERTDWYIMYSGREDYVNDIGEVEKVEHFRMGYTGNGYFIVRMIHPEDFKEAYDNDAAEFFSYEAESLLSDAENDNVKFYQYTEEVFNAKTEGVLFNRLRSGTWMAFLIELDKDGKLTGNYAETDFYLEEEKASESFSKWLGNWRVSNGLVGYDLFISSIDNNFIYKIEGWEQGDAVSFQMNEEYLEGEFWEPDGCLYIRSQYLGTYDDTDFGHGTVDELFMGNIFDSQGLTVITDEGVDLAKMIRQEEGAELEPLGITIETDSGTYPTTFHSMQYYMWAYSDSGWYPYNSNVAKLPLTMTRLSVTRSAGVAPAKERTVTKASIHHSQPKSGTPARNSVAKKAVRMK